MLGSAVPVAGEAGNPKLRNGELLPVKVRKPFAQTLTEEKVLP